MNIPNFDDLRVVTTTVIVESNIVINNRSFIFENLPVEDVQVPRTLKTQKSIKKFILEKNYPSGTIITLQDLRKIRGFKIKRCKQWVSAENISPFWKPNDAYEYQDIVQYCGISYTSLCDVKDDCPPIESPHWIPIQTLPLGKKYFRNQIIIDIIINNKFINCKIPLKGKIQLTGCISHEHVEQTIYEIWKKIDTLSQQLPDLYSFDMTNAPSSIKTPRLFFTPNIVMMNKTFNLNFLVNRKKLDSYINMYTEYTSLMSEDTSGYPGVNIKLPRSEDKYITTVIDYDGKMEYEHVDYNKWINTLSPIEKTKERNRNRNISFLVFISGAIVITGKNKECMLQSYYNFMNLIKKCHKEIKIELSN